jgi:hypothetical protein
MTILKKYTKKNHTILLYIAGIEKKRKKNQFFFAKCFLLLKKMYLCLEL